jgi:hypothetical protein
MTRSGLVERTGARHRYDIVTSHAWNAAFADAVLASGTRTGARHGYETETRVS